MRFDWSTLVLQTVNVLVLLWLLRRFLFRPIVDIIVARKNAAEQMLAQAATARSETEASAEALARHERELAADRDRVLADARASAEAEQTRLLALAKDQAVQLRNAADAALEREREQMRHELEKEAGDLAVTIASHLLGRVPAPAVNAALLQSLGAWLSDVAPNELESLAMAEEALEVVTATPLDAAARAACATMLAQRLGHTPMLRFRADPSLIAGVELRNSHARLYNNWRADLDRIAQELNRDDKPLAVA
jgi:F-type H+-transporting ATPase subunit b